MTVKNSTAIRNTLKAYERLKREQHIDTLFRTGKAYSFFPVKFIYTMVPRSAAETSPVLAGFTVPKKKFRKSVQRHRIARLLREAWRLNKHSLYAAVPANMQLHVFLIHTGTEMPEFATIQEVVIKGVAALQETASKHVLS